VGRSVRLFHMILTSKKSQCTNTRTSCFVFSKVISQEIQFSRKWKFLITVLDSVIQLQNLGKCRGNGAASAQYRLPGIQWRHYWTSLSMNGVSILDAFANSSEKRLLATCLSICPHGTNLITLEEFSWNFTLENIFDSVDWNQFVSYNVTAYSVLHFNNNH
jgi:hypothetical protein